MNDVTRILSEIDRGDANASELLLPLVYEELRKLAAAKLAQEKPGHTLQPTALVHEAYVRLVDGEQAQHWNGRHHFFGAAAEAMRRILVDNARRKEALKRGGDRRRHATELDQLPMGRADSRVLEVDQALRELEQEQPVVAKLVVLRFFGGMSQDEAAALLEISPRTAYRYWSYAKAWLRASLEPPDAESP